MTTNTKPAKAPAAKKAAEAKPAKAPAKATATAAATETTASDKPQAGVATITFDKDHHGGKVRGAVNGEKFEFAVGEKVQVTEAQLNVLNDSGARFTVDTPLAGVDAAEGSAASTTVEGTALRLGEEDGTLGKGVVDEDGNPVEPHELRQITDKELTDGADQQASKEQAEGGADKDTAGK